MDRKKKAERCEILVDSTLEINQGLNYIRNKN